MIELIDEYFELLFIGDLFFFAATIFFFAKMIGNVNEKRVGILKFGGPLLLLLPSVLNWKGKKYAFGMLISGSIFFTILYLLSVGIK
jgi:hypothetical protein